METVKPLMDSVGQAFSSYSWAEILGGAALAALTLTANYYWAKLYGRGWSSVLRLVLTGIRRLMNPPPGELAEAILSEIQKHGPRDQEGHTIWYGPRLHFYGDENVGYIDRTPIDASLTKRERALILQIVRDARRRFAEMKVKELQSGGRSLGTGEIVRVDVT